MSTQHATTSPASIHPTATVDPDARLDPTARVGPHAFVGPDVELAPGVELGIGVILEGRVSVGANTRIGHYTTVGGLPQDFKFTGDMTSAGVRIGEHCQIREHAVIHAATSETTPTTIGDRVFVMSQSHIGHDCQVGEEAIVTTLVALGGHVELGARAVVGGVTGVHQHCRIGRLAMVSGGTCVTADIPPFSLIGNRNSMHGLNLVGLRRSGTSSEQISLLRKAYREFLHVSRSREDTVAGLRTFADRCPLAGELADFYETANRAIAEGIGTPPNQFRRWLASFGLVSLRDGDHDTDA